MTQAANHRTERSPSPRARLQVGLGNWARVARDQPLASVGGLALLMLGAASFLPNLFATSDPFAQDVGRRLLAPNGQNFFGTDELGRDIYSRVVYGIGLTMFSGFGVVALAASVGTVLGLVAGAVGGFWDGLVMRVSDMFLSFPGLIMAMAIVSFVGPSLVNAMLATALIWWPQYSRLVRAQVLAVKELPYIEAARSTGANEFRVVVRHIFPNCMVPILVKASIDFSYAILITASLSFLAVGAQPPSPELGAMVTSGRVYLLSAWWYATFPSLVIFVAVLALNLVADAIRDLLDPTLRAG